MRKVQHHHIKSKAILCPITSFLVFPCKALGRTLLVGQYTNQTKVLMEVSLPIMFKRSLKKPLFCLLSHISNIGIIGPPLLSCVFNKTVGGMTI